MEQIEAHATMARRSAIDLHLNHLIQEISGLLTNESRYCQRIEELSTDLNAFKTAYTTAEKSKREVEEKLQKLQQESDKDKHDFESQILALKGSERRVICLIDGDGTIFSPDLIAQGQEGGHAAAKMLAESVRQDFSTKYHVEQFNLWVHVFYNKRGLVDAIGRAGFWNAKQKFEDFALGFNQAAERFVMVDVGNGKEAADAKLKVLLEDNIRLPQTCKILFGGCHDNGYATGLRSLITAGFQDKLVLLRGYTESAAGIEELGLPSMNIPQLFIPDKLSTSHAPLPGVKQSRSRSGSFVDALPPASRAPTPLPPSSLQSSCIYIDDSPPSVSDLGLDLELDPLPFAPEKIITCSRPPAPPSYKSALQMVQMVQKRPSTPELDASSTSSDTSDEPLTDPRASPPLTRSKHVNPNIALSKHKPPPCTLFYLANCKHGADCKYGHDYILQDEHYGIIRDNAKKAPCPAKNRNEVCTFGDNCCYGHICPLTTKCHFLKEGRCKFRGAGMHKDLSIV
jgi:hypothetical protein